jgi:hypothetical protein
MPSGKNKKLTTRLALVVVLGVLSAVAAGGVSTLWGAVFSSDSPDVIWTLPVGD